MFCSRDIPIPIAILFATLLAPCCLQAAEPVGSAVLIKTEVTGEGGVLKVDDPVHRDERIRTSEAGLGQFTFRDGTKLAVGQGSSVVIDKFVFDDADSVKKLTIKAAKGTFRWISGNSNSSAYQIVTPAGTIGVRGTAFDFYVGRNGTTAIVLLNGAAQFCGSGGCRQLKQQCDCVIAKRNGDISDPRRVDRDALRVLGNEQALPFLSGDQQLYGRLGMVGAGGCGLASARSNRPVGRAPLAAPQSTPDTPSQPDAPSPPDTPRAADPPSTPSTPQAPDHPDKPDKGGKPHGHHHDEGPHGWGGDGWGGHGWGGHGSGRGDHGHYR